MKNFIFIILLAFAFIAGLFSFVFAHENAENESLKGKEILEKIQTKEVQCADLNEEDFHNLGEHFMDLMMGDNYKAMNKMMEQMMGRQEEEQMHIAMGKRTSGCDLSAPFPSRGVGFMPMMMAGGNYGMMGNMMMGNFGFWGGWGILGLIFGLLIWALIILGIIALIKYIRKK
jgi:hypothetical protein